ncbi:MAG: trigger factor [Anaerolineae bacterium]|nr:trigger factor [Anaerolineae bacterium]MBT7073796.1 trigger factor [Anaerolineae bacterium]MBT7783690.1 trigger factor [Anaerolineae bacterium]
MKIETTPREDHQITMTVELDQERMDIAKKRAARQMAKRGKIAGFRPGKAPYSVIVQNYGEQAIVESAVDILLEEVYPQALEEAKLEPGAQGSLEEMESLVPPKFVFVIPLKSEIDLGDYHSIRMDYKFVETGEAEVDAKLAELQEMYKNTEEVERPIEEGDYIKADIIGKDGDEVVYEMEDQPIFITADKREGEKPFEGFAKKLVGASVGESKKMTKTHAKDDEDEKLQGLKVKYSAKILVVHGTKLPELDDEFAQKLSGGTMEELRKIIAEDIAKEARSEYDDEFYTELIDKIKEGATIKYPPQVLAEQTKYVLEDIKQRLSQQGMEFEAYLKMQETDLEKFTEEEARPAAIKQLERGMIFDEVADKEKLEVQEEDLNTEFNQAISGLTSQGFDFNNIKGGQRAQKDIANNIAQQSAAQLMTRMTLERLKDIATGDFAKAEKEAAKAAKEAEKAEKEVEKTEEVAKTEKKEEASE